MTTRIEDIRKAYPELTANMDDTQLVRFLTERGYQGRIYTSHFPEPISLEEIFAKLQEEQAKTEKKSAKPNLRTLERARIYNHLSPFLKSLRVAPTAKECIAKIKEYPAYRDKNISRQRMETILSEGSSGKYDDIKNIR